MLSAKEIRVMSYIVEFNALNGFSPSIRNIKSGADFKAISSVHAILRSLEEKGLIKRSKNVSRSIIVLRLSEEEDKPIELEGEKT
jgi:SOS-response transcriptional repressor LexA